MDDNSSLVGVTPGELRGGRGGGRGGRKFPVPWVSNIDCCRPPGKVGRFVCLTHLQISENKQLASNAWLPMDQFLTQKHKYVHSHHVPHTWLNMLQSLHLTFGGLGTGSCSLPTEKPGGVPP